MITVTNEGDQVQIPGWVVDLESFRRWVDSDEVPEKHRVCFLRGEVWVDMSREQVLTHNQVKNELAFTITGLVKAGLRGMFFPDGAHFTNATANISGVPDGIFANGETLERGRVQLIPGRHGGYLEVSGVPDLVIEVVSESSVHKDTVVLREAYWEAGIAEYWLVDACPDPPQFNILQRGRRGYTVARKQEWAMRSKVLGRSFRLVQRPGPFGYTEYAIEVI